MQRSIVSDAYNDYRGAWIAREEQAERMIPIIGRLYREHGVVTSIHGRRLINRGPVDIIKAHKYARLLDGSELSLDRSLAMLEAIERLQPASASIDLGRLAMEYSAAPAGTDLDEWLRGALAVLGSAAGPDGAQQAQPAALIALDGTPDDAAEEAAAGDEGGGGAGSDVGRVGARPQAGSSA